MKLPDSLKEIIEKEFCRIKLSDLNRYAAELSHRYRQSDPTLVDSTALRIAYLAARFPATYAVIYKVLQEVRERTSEPIESLIDYGAGPGTVIWAAIELFSDLKKMILLEKDSSFIELGKRLIAERQENLKILWKNEDLEKKSDFEMHDLSLMSYSIGEIAEKKRLELVKKIWEYTKKICIFIEPGTPAGFERIRQIRNILMDQGAHLISPCPHSKECPMSGRNWCHFSQRIERSSLHRKAKSAFLNYEDEKFSYVALAKKSFPLPFSRILRHPQKRSGHVSLTLCTAEGLKQSIISKKEKSLYSSARKAQWGESFDSTKDSSSSS